LSLHTVFFWPPEKTRARQKLMRWRSLGPVGGGACTCTRRVKAVAALVGKATVGRKQKTRASRNGPCTSHRSMHPRKAPVISKNTDFHSTRTVKSNSRSKIAFERVSKRKKNNGARCRYRREKKKSRSASGVGRPAEVDKQEHLGCLVSPLKDLGFPGAESSQALYLFLPASRLHI
jgi:hypothetical protein